MTSENNTWALPAPQESLAVAAGIPAADSVPSARDGAESFAAVAGIPAADSASSARDGAESLAAAAGIPAAGSAPSARDGAPGALLWVAAGLLVASALALVAQLFTHSGDGPAQVEFSALLAKEAVAIVLAVACAVLLLIRRTRRVVEGVVCALGLLYPARDLNELRPSLINAAEGSIGYRLLAASLILTAAAGAVVLVRILRESRRPRDRQTRADRGTALLGGLVGAAIWFVAETMPALRVAQHSGSGAAATIDCCGWSNVIAWTRTGMITSGIALLAVAVLAAIGRSRARSFGLLLGAVLFLADEVVDLAVQMIAPVPSVFGMDRAASVTASGLGLTVDPLPAFWAGALGIAILAAVAVLRLALAPKPAPFPEARRRPRLG